MRKRSSVVRENVFFVPEEILYEILSWLGVNSLLRCKSVCKIWYAVIKNKQFVEMHAMRNGHRFRNIKCTSRIRYSDGSEEKLWYLHNSCRGLVLERRFSSATKSTTYQISNPTTELVLDLPCPRDAVKIMFVFLNYSTSSHNVVSVYYGGVNKNEKLELVDLGGQSYDLSPNADLSWRTLHISEFDNFSRQQRYFFRYCMSSKGVLYILALETGQPSIPKIICADLVKQTSTTVDAPQSIHFKWHKVNIQLWKGQPSITFILEDELNVWMLEDYKKQKWADTIVIPMTFLKQNPRMRMALIPRICPIDEKECLVYHNDNTSDIVYNPESKEFFTIPTTPVTVPATFVSVRGMQPRRKDPGAR